MSNTKTIKQPPLMQTRYQELEAQYQTKCDECEGFRVALNNSIHTVNQLSGINHTQKEQIESLEKANKYYSLNLWVRLGKLLGMVELPKDCRKTVFP